MNFAGAVDTEIVSMDRADLTEQLAITHHSRRFCSPRAQVGSYCGRSDLGGCTTQGRADRIDSVLAAMLGDKVTINAVGGRSPPQKKPTPA